MQAFELISNVIPPLRTSHTVQEALDRMNEFKLCHLPIVNENQFLGLISEEELIEARDPQMPVGGLSLSILNPFVFEDAHFYDVISLFNQLKLSMVPVLDKHRNYTGLIAIHHILDATAEMYSVKETGAILVLSISNRNNSLAHMAQIIEADNARILSSYISSFPDSARLEVTLKINRTELSGIIATFERYGYEIKAIFNHHSHDDGTADRFDSFMNYLNV